MIGGSSRMKPDNLKLMKEKAPKAKPEKAPKKEGDVNWVSPKEATSTRSRRGWLPTPSPTFGRPTLEPTEEPTTTTFAHTTEKHTI